jgi:secernin
MTNARLNRKGRHLTSIALRKEKSMGGDTLVALGSATAGGSTLFGHNRHGRAVETIVLQREPGRAHAPEEFVGTPFARVPQARQTFTVLGCRSPQTWGYDFGVNQHGVAVARSAWQSKLPGTDVGLTGPDLVRLALERSRTARQALETVTDLVARYGQCRVSGRKADSAFLVADAREAYLVETAGSSWAWLECRDLRAVSDISLIRQDWQRLAPGLAEHTIAEGWWPDDGSKLDFGCINDEPLGSASALRRWGRASLLLEQQHGHIDLAFLRRLLSDHYEGTKFEVDPLEPTDGPRSICRHMMPGEDTGTTASFLATLPAADDVAVAWCAFGPPCLSVYLPIFLDGELPEIYHAMDPAVVPWHPQTWMERLMPQPHRWEMWRQALANLQARFDQETEEFLSEAAQLKRRGENSALQRQCTLFMQNHQEQLEAEFYRLASPARRRPVFSSVE